LVSSERANGVVSERGQGSLEDPRHVHLGDADLLGDLALRHRGEETQIQHGPFALGQCRQQGPHCLTVGDVVEAVAKRLTLQTFSVEVRDGAIYLHP
jgi:hypothetical protein